MLAHYVGKLINGNSYNIYLTGFMNQVSADWASQPLVNIVATNETTCPSSAPEIVFGRHFYGLNIGCDCLGIRSKSITGDDSMVVGY